LNELRYRPPRTLRSKAWIYWYRAKRALRSPKWWWSTGLLVAFWVWVGWPFWQSHPARGVLHLLAGLFLTLFKAMRYSAPREMKLVEFEYQARKNRLYKLLKQLQYQRDMAPREIALFQQEVLQLIASYVRGYRADMHGREVFTNLVVIDGEEMVVLARNQDHRQVGARYPKHDMVAWAAMQRGEAAVLGDLAREFPAIAVTKRYRSIMALPIMGEHGVLGAVSIDSGRPHDFDAECDKLERYLAPYVCLLGWTIAPKQHNLPESEGIAPSAGGPS
jgi:hypothetical protein